MMPRALLPILLFMGLSCYAQERPYALLQGDTLRLGNALVERTFLWNGGDLKTLQELMGFDDMSVGIAYLSVTDIHVKDVFNRTHPRA